MVIVRPVAEADAPQIVTLLNEIIARGTFTAMDQEVTLEDQRAFIRRFPGRGVFHAAVTSDSQILGIEDVVPLAAASKVYAHVGEISTFVRQDAQGKGVGRILSQATFQAACHNGFEKIMATVRGDNPRAIAFYRSQGFRRQCHGNADAQRLPGLE
jgi:L-amino acid N-acyltransferase YncA